MAFHETRTRSVAKAVTYRVLIMTADGLFVYFVTHSQSLALTFVIVSNLYTTLLYLVHERVWDRISWGKVARAFDKPGRKQ